MFEKNRKKDAIDKQRIDLYYNGKYTLNEEKYLSDIFVEESNGEVLKSIFKEQWDKSLLEDPCSHKLDHILFKINYTINSSSPKIIKPPLVRLFNWYARVAAIILIPLLVYAGITTYFQQNSVVREGWAEISAPLGARIKFTLPDGSLGWLNSGSTIKYSMNFTRHKEVLLTGQAYFDVKNNEDNKFVVKTKYLDVEVKGTSFDVAAYEDGEEVDITLERGSVLLRSTNFKVPIEMKPNEQVCYNIKKHTITKKNVVAKNFLAWKEGKLILRNTSLKDLSKQLSRWYNVDVRTEDLHIADFSYRATFEDENLTEVLRLLKLSSPLDIQIEERQKMPDGSFSKQKILLKVKSSFKPNKK